MKQNTTLEAPFAKAQDKPAEEANPAAVQLREAFEEIVTLKADRNALKTETETLTRQRDTAIARIVILESNGKIGGGAMPATEHPDGSLTLSVTVSNDLMPHMKEWALASDKTLEEFVREQIQESLQTMLGAY